MNATERKVMVGNLVRLPQQLLYPPQFKWTATEYFRIDLEPLSRIGKVTYE
jgi:hypothetical protein